MLSPISPSQHQHVLQLTYSKTPSIAKLTRYKVTIEIMFGLVLEFFVSLSSADSEEKVGEVVLIEYIASIKDVALV